jgi:hypothetical protein
MLNTGDSQHLAYMCFLLDLRDNKYSSEERGKTNPGEDGELP